MSANTTSFRALRGFYLRGVGDIARGALLQLTDAEAQALIWMEGTIERVAKATTAACSSSRASSGGDRRKNVAAAARSTRMVGCGSPHDGRPMRRASCGIGAWGHVRMPQYAPGGAPSAPRAPGISARSLMDGRRRAVGRRGTDLDVVALQHRPATFWSRGFIRTRSDGE